MLSAARNASLRTALVIMLISAPLGGAMAQDANPQPPASQLPPAVSKVLGGATIRPIPGAKPVELYIPPPNGAPQSGQQPPADKRP